MSDSVWARALRHKSFVVGALLTLLMTAAALLSLVWTPHPVAEIDIPNRFAPPSAANWLGTDSLGRDLFSQLLVGSQNSIVVGIVAVGIGLVIGVVLGCIASARRGWVEELVMRASDFTFAFPALLSAIMLTAIYGPGLLMSIVAIGIFNVPVFARVARAPVLSVKEMEFVTAARCLGMRDARIIFQHILPNTLAPLIVQVSLALSWSLLTEAGLSFLGLGTQPRKGLLAFTIGHVGAVPGVPISDVRPGLAGFTQRAAVLVSGVADVVLPPHFHQQRRGQQQHDKADGHPSRAREPA